MINISHSPSMDVSEKNYIEKRLLKMFLTEDEVLIG